MTLLHAKILKDLLDDENWCDLKQKDLAADIDKSESSLSRFLGGHNDLKAGEFLELIKSMPVEFQDEYWQRYHAEWQGLMKPPERKPDIFIIFSNNIAIGENASVVSGVSEKIDDVLERLPDAVLERFATEALAHLRRRRE